MTNPFMKSGGQSDPFVRVRETEFGRVRTFDEGSVPSIAIRRGDGANVGDDIPQIGYQGVVESSPGEVLAILCPTPKEDFTPYVVEGAGFDTAKLAAESLERHRVRVSRLGASWPDDFMHIWLPVDTEIMICDAIADPDGIWFDQELLPSLNGFIMLQDPVAFAGAFGVTDPQDATFKAMKVNAISWCVADSRLRVTLHTGREFAGERWTWCDGHVEAQFVHRFGAGRFLAALFNLMSQTGVLEQQNEDIFTHETIRVGKRRSKRRVTTVHHVRVIHLRPGTPHSDAYAAQTDGSRIFQHRWVVRGHWRLQPYLSIRGRDGKPVRRRIWIAPHLKGPDGAPLLTGPKILAVHPPQAPGATGSPAA